MKILMLGTRGNGGILSVIESYMNSNVSKKFPIKFIPTNEHGNLVKRIFIFIKALIIFSTYLPNNSYKIVHVHFSQSGSLIRKFIILILSCIFRKKIVIQTHGAKFFPKYEAYPFFQKKIIALFFRMSDVVIALSSIRKTEYSRIVNESKILVIPNFVTINKKIKTSSNFVRLIFLGKLIDDKGLTDLIRAVKIISKVNFCLYIAGEGDIEKYMKFVTELNLNNKINFLGWISGERKKMFFENADIFVLPSYFEDLPMSILEAMSYKLPIISTTVAGIPEIVKDGYNGYLVKPGNIEELASKLEIIIRDTKLRKKMGERSLEIISSNYEMSVVEKEIIKLYTNLIKKVKC